MEWVKLYALSKSSDGGIPPTRLISLLCGGRSMQLTKSVVIYDEGSIVSAGTYFPMLL
jgi:hypothetical protein